MKKLLEIINNAKSQIKCPLHLTLDAGHGVNTGGKRSQDGSLRENHVNTSIRDKVALLCYIAKQNGLDITYNFLSPEHTDTSLSERCRREHKIFAEVKKTRFYQILSIHSDAYSDESANGTGTFINPKSKSRYFAEILQRNMVKDLGLKDRGVREKRFKILRSTHGYCVLVEVAFMTNPRELKLLKDDSFRNKVALCIFKSFLEYAAAYQDELFFNK